MSGLARVRLLAGWAREARGPAPGCPFLQQGPASARPAQAAAGKAAAPPPSASGCLELGEGWRKRCGWGRVSPCPGVAGAALRRDEVTSAPADARRRPGEERGSAGPAGERCLCPLSLLPRRPGKCLWFAALTGPDVGRAASPDSPASLPAPGTPGTALRGGQGLLSSRRGSAPCPLPLPGKLTPGGKAAQAGVGVGDWVLSIDGELTSPMTHIEAQNRIRACGDRLCLTLSRVPNALGKQQKDSLPCSEPPKYNFAPSTALNKTARPFGASSPPNPRPGLVTKPVTYAPLAPACTPQHNGQVSVPDSSPGAVMKTEPGLAPRTPTATPGPASRPPWAVDPSFAERYAPDKTSTVLSKHSQPATPTPMQNRSSIVQAAQQAPEGPGRTPLCYKCNKVIRGRYLVALGHYYHPEEFICCQCRKVLDEGGFFEEKGSIFCPKCYDSRYAPSCAKCKKKITGEVMHALKMTWHVQCFTCAACKTPIRNRAFYMEEGQPYCERDYEKMFGTKCRGCDFKIDAGDRFLEALGFSWHDTCFVCAICQTNLEGKTFYSKKDKPLCKSHAFSHV
ncbi:PDZ and LIM domain protein 7 isoform X3 [Dromaius novaehollandiae]|uniref:PDZ and LIM domain protein 7 isoform X3 n=1 Tax=Dromaius novaehollandiae TaxID=8790 RepID=UPI00311ECA91